MVRSYWIGPVLVVLAVTGLAWSQIAPTGSAPAPKDHTLTVQETDKLSLKCKILKMWHEPDGSTALLVQAVVSGERITLVLPGAATPPAARAPVAAKIYHWGAEKQAPADAPIAPADAIVYGTPGGFHGAPATVVANNPKPPPANGQPVASPYAPEMAGAAPVKTAAPIMAKNPQSSGQRLPSPYQPEVGATVVAKSTVPAGQRLPSPYQPEVGATVVAKNAVPAGPHSPSPYLPEAGAKPVKEATIIVAKNTVPAGQQLLSPYAPATAGAKSIEASVKEKQSPDAYTLEAKDVKSENKTTAAAPLSPYVAHTSQTAAGPSTAQTTKPATPLVSIEPAKPGDWRQSWGRVETSAPAQVVKNDKPRAAETSPLPPVDLPHADTSKPDPLQQPERHVKLPKPAPITTKPAPPVVENSKPVQLVKNTVATPGLPAKPDLLPPADPKMANLPTKPIETKSAEMQPPYPLGMGSVYQAKIEQPPTLPQPPSEAVQPDPAAGNVYDGGNAFTSPQQPPFTPNQAAPQLNYPPGNPLPRPMMPKQQPGASVISMERVVPSGMANAFTTGGNVRPIPADFGKPTQDGNAFTTAEEISSGPQMASQPYPNTGAPAAPSMMDRRPLAVQAPLLGNNTPQLLAVLRDSLYPSQREWAADGLASLRGSQSQPQVVQGLVAAAKEDPAATVRASCVRALVQLHINTASAVAVVQALKADSDPRVRREAEAALLALTGNQPLPLDPSLRPVSGN